MTASRIYASRRSRPISRFNSALSAVVFIGIALCGAASAQVAEDENADLTADATEVCQATVAVEEWSTGQVRIEAPFLKTGPVHWKLPTRSRQDSSLPEIQSNERGIVIRAPYSVIAELMSAGTRSLWVEAGATQCRIDLPAVELLEYHHADEEGSNDVHCSWRVANLLPGFSLWLARQNESDEQPRGPSMLPMRRGADGFIREVRATDDWSEIDLVFPASSDAELKSRYHFTIVNPDGSRSQSLAILRHGNTFVGAVESLSSPIPAGVDEPVEVPAVELHTVAEAIELAKEALLVPSFVDLQTGRMVLAESADGEAMVVRQGIAPGTVALRGQALLLALSSSPRIVAKSDSPAARFAREQAIDVGANDGFVDVSPRHELLASGSLGPELKTTAPDDASQLSESVDHDELATDDSTLVLSISPDSGVDLVADRSAEAHTRAANLRAAVNAGIRFDGTVILPGPPGRFLKGSIDTIKDDLSKAAERGQADEILSAGRAMDLAVEHLNLHLEERDRAQIIEAWKDAVARQMQPVLLGGKEQNRTAVDVAAGFLSDLSSRHLFDSARYIQVGSGPSGERLALVGAPSTQAPARAAGGARGLTAHSGARTVQDHAASPTARRTAQAPKGPATVVEVSVPSKVRVPALRGKFPQSASQLVSAAGLRLLSGGAARDGFVIAASNPPAGAWVKPQTGVELLFNCKVPRLVGMSLADARKELARLDLKIDSQLANANPREIVRTQHPDPGTLVRQNSVIQLTMRTEPVTTAAKMPNLLNHSMAEAKRVLDPLGLRLSERPPAEQRYPTRPTEERAKQGQLVIDHQSVPAGRNVDRGTLVSVALIRLVAPTARVRVPNFIGANVTDAVAMGRRMGLVVHAQPQGQSTSNQQQHTGHAPAMVVKDQSIKVGTEVAAGTRVDVIVAAQRPQTAEKMPNLLNHSLEEARRIVEPLGVRLTERPPAEQRYPTRPIQERAKQGQLVIDHQSVPAGRNVDRGTLVSVILVRLVAPTARVRVPSLIGANLTEAVATGRRMGLVVHAQPQGRPTANQQEHAGHAPEMVVKDQSIKVGTEVAVGTRIDVILVAQRLRTVVVLDLRGMTFEAAERRGRDSGFIVRRHPQARVSTRPIRQGEHVGQTIIDSQSVVGGTRVNPGVTVDVTLVRLTALKSGGKMPDLTNQSMEEARKLLDPLGVRLTERPPSQGQYPTRPTQERAKQGQLVIERQSVPAARDVDGGTLVSVILVRLVAPSVPVAKVKVPRLLGKTLEEATAEATRLGLNIRPPGPAAIARRPTDKTELIDKTLVERQSIEPGTPVDKKTVIAVALARYMAAGVLVPNFKGMTPELSIEAAKKASIVVKHSVVPVSSADPGQVGKALIERQSILPGTRVSKGTVVALWVAKFMPRITKIKVPNFQNMTPQDAGRLAAQIGLVVQFPPRGKIARVPTDNPALVGKVLVAKQSIPPGQEVNTGAVIQNELVQFHAPGTPVPSFVGMTIEQARARGESLGFALSVRQANPVHVRPARMGERPGTFVENQSIPPGTAAGRGAKVEVSLVRVVFQHPRPPGR